MARKKKIDPQEKKMFRYDVYDDSWTEHYAPLYNDDGDAYTRGDSSTSHSIIGIFPSEYGDIVTDIDVSKNPDVYLVYAIWSTGDSFGRDSGKNLTPVHLFDSRDKAEACLKAIEDHNKNRYEILNRSVAGDYSVHFIGNDGTPMIEYAGWIGYFEGLDYADIEGVSLLSERELSKLKKERRW